MGDVSQAIEVSHLSFRYQQAPVLVDVTTTVPSARFSVLLGRNGSGKSTLLRLLAGMLPVPPGTVRIEGRDLARLAGAERARVIGFLPQQHRPVFPFAVRDVVLTGRASHVRFAPGRDDERKASAALDRVGMTHLADRPFTELSGGEQQLVMVARVLAQEPRVIMLDEPTSHLDFLNQARLLSLVRQLVETGYTVLAVLHDPNSAFLYGDHFLFLKGGRLQELEAGENPWDRQVLQRIYDEPIETVPYGGRAIVVPPR